MRPTVIPGNDVVAALCTVLRGRGTSLGDACSAGDRHMKLLDGQFARPRGTT